MKALSRNRAFALVLVLITIVLAATMAIFFLSSVGRERRGVDLYARGSQARHLANMSINKVMGQINAATKEGTADAPVSWASQPGMVRTYGVDGNLKNAYKLYSWDNMVEAGAGFSATASGQLPPANWATDVALFTDLNQPMSDVYPIVDPRAEMTGGSGVEGFAIDESNPAVAGSSSQAPMPVKWLYILEDGQMVAPTSGGEKIATVPGASGTNPIVGRVAFWTDDETSKVNINTASEGAYWDLPRGASRDELQFSGNTPVKGEYQRTAGHPAMTSLSAVFPELLSSTDRWKNVTTYRSEMQGIDDLTPRVRWGGSQGGTFPVDTWAMDYSPAYNYINSPAHAPPGPITMGTDRLYVSADDFWFRPDRQANAALDAKLDPKVFSERLFFVTANSRAPETTLFETPRISLWPITWPNKSSYYQTRGKLSGITIPSSLDPKTTAIADNPWTTAEEKLLAFCATLNTGAGAASELRYYFQRQNPDSPTFDWTSSGLSRNQDLVRYLRASMDKEVPGFGGSLATNLGGDNADWIALNSFDYVRSMVNQFTAPSLTQGVKYSYTGLGSRYGKFEGVPTSTSSAYTEVNSKTVVPLNVSLNGNNYVTQGAFPSLKEAAVVFYATQRIDPVAPVNPSGVNPGDPSYKEPGNPYNWRNLINTGGAVGYDNGTPADPSDDSGARTTQMRAVLLLDFSKLNPGTDYFAPAFWVKVSGGSFSVNGASIDLPGGGSRVVQCAYDTTGVVAPKWTAPLFVRGVSSTAMGIAKAFTNDSTAVPAKTWSLVSDPIPVNPNASSFNFEGSEITVEIYACDPNDVDLDPTSDSTRRISTKTINFTQWNGSFAIPVAPRWSMVSANYHPDGSDGNWKIPDNASASPDPYYRGYAPFTALNPGIMPVRATGTSPYAAETRDPRWVFAEYVPLLAAPTSALSSTRLYDTTGQMNFATARPALGYFPYMYRATQVLPQPAYDAVSGDADDATQPATALSTNFRKRVMGLNQRSPNSRNRAEFYIDGYTTRPPAQTRDGDIYIVSADFQNMEGMSLITPYDTVLGMVADPGLAGGGNGDPRLNTSAVFRRIDQVLPGSAPAPVLPTTASAPIGAYFPLNTVGKQFHQLGTPSSAIPASTGYRALPAMQGTNLAQSGGDPASGTTGKLGMPTAVASAAGANFNGLIGMELGPDMKVPAGADWTSAAGQYPDGGFLARPNQEYQQMAQDSSWAGLNILMIPYFAKVGSYLQNQTSNATAEVSYFSPNAQIPSPVILGTLPSSLSEGWQTLAFSPNPAAGSAHPGLSGTPDHLLLDLFWMPVAEPYPISDQFSTAGKVNLNYAIMPFNYISRKTGLHAALKATWINALPRATGPDYKSHYWMNTNHGSVRTRYPIDVGSTLRQFDDKFSGGDIFRSASEICEVFLYPSDPATGTSLVSYDANSAAIRSWWSGQELTTDNGREEPYNAIYSRVTTKSNTFTVHWRVQVLRKLPSAEPETWDESKDRIAAELRGSTLIERFIDTSKKDIPDYATNAQAAPLSQFYKWRVVSENYFQP
jgi:hypothetical protein